MSNNFFESVQKSSTSEIKDFINTQFGGQVNFRKDDDGSSVLHFASFYAGNAEVVKVFVSMGAIVNAQAYNGATSLHIAGDAQIAKTLVSLGADLNAKAKDGRTPLHYAVNNKVPEVVNALVDLGADMNIKDDTNHTPFLYAVCTGKVEIAEILLSKGVNVNYNEGPMSPLHMLVMSKMSGMMSGENTVPMAKLLIANGADINAKTQNGQTPLDLAKNVGNTEMVQYLSGIQDKAEIDRISAMYANRLRDNPNDAKVYEDRGTMFMSHAMANGRNKAFIDQAMADFTKAIELGPQAASVYAFRAGAYSQINDLDHAIADYDSAIRIEPDNAESYAFRGCAYSQKGNYDKALADFKEALRLNPKCLNAYCFRSVMYFGKSVENKEKADFDKAVEDIDKALTDVEKAVKIDPNYEGATFLIKDITNEKEVIYRLRREEEERKHEEQQRIEQSNKWAEQGLCRHCGGKMGGLFTKKCKSCKRKN
jgi:ankyrin repeat protein